MKRKIDIIALLSVISGLYIVVCDYLVQMTTIEADYFVARLMSLDDFVIYMSSYGCIFAFPFWILGIYLVYKTMCKVNKNLSIFTSAGIVYSLFMLAFFHYSYVMIHNVKTVETDWSTLTNANVPFYPFMFLLLPVLWLIVGISNFSSKAIIPKWTILVNPVMLTIISSIITWIAPKALCLQPGVFSLGITVYYVVCWMSLKKNSND
ncbi:MAG: hypothetical protein K5874_07290 [Bacteroidaceae bacterium]|nr:hypothetical protein [Bacteroidaceae bacterium]